MHLWTNSGQRQIILSRSRLIYRWTNRWSKSKVFHWATVEILKVFRVVIWQWECQMKRDTHHMWKRGNDKWCMWLESSALVFERIFHWQDESHSISHIFHERNKKLWCESKERKRGGTIVLVVHIDKSNRSIETSRTKLRFQHNRKFYSLEDRASK